MVDFSMFSGAAMKKLATASCLSGQASGTWPHSAGSQHQTCSCLGPAALLMEGWPVPRTTRLAGTRLLSFRLLGFGAICTSGVICFAGSSSEIRTQAGPQGVVSNGCSTSIGVRRSNINLSIWALRRCGSPHLFPLLKQRLPHSMQRFTTASTSFGLA